MPGLLKLLFKTFIISLIVGIAITCIWYMISHKQDTDYSHVLPLIAEGGLYINIILVIMSLPMLFLVTQAIRNNKFMNLLLYFAGPVVLFVTIFFMQANITDKVFYLILAATYLVVHTFYYFKTLKKLA